ncbi:MAG: aldose 1-epimerase family protein [Chloroflexi bacterium]|nr:aldose 1-epimerase family protein [Chloroflexota bacterium]
MIHLYNRDWSREQLLRYVDSVDQIAGIRLLEAGDGRERGVRMFHVWTGAGLTFDVLADRALDIAAFQFQGMSLSWISSVGNIHPAYYEPHGGAWLRSFQGGLFVTCGLDHFGGPCVDGDEELGVHGRISNLAASQISYRTEWNGDDYELEISGRVRQTRVYGENLVLRRKISTALGSNQVRIDDVVTNEGREPHPHMILYHFNLGFPLITEDAVIVMDAEETVPTNPAASDRVAHWRDLDAPTSGFAQEVFRHRPAADERGRVRIAVKNPGLGVGLQWTFERDALPYVYQWKQMGDGTYVLGIEPSNCGYQGRCEAREQDALPYLDPGESQSYSIDVEVIER